MKLHIERAAEDVHGTLTEIAHAAKRHWGYPERWMQFWRDVLTITPDYINENDVYVARWEGEVVGFYALAGSGAKVTLDHLWLSPAQIGSGIRRRPFHYLGLKAPQLGGRYLETQKDTNAARLFVLKGAEPMR